MDACVLYIEQLIGIPPKFLVYSIGRWAVHIGLTNKQKKNTKHIFLK